MPTIDPARSAATARAIASGAFAATTGTRRPADPSGSGRASAMRPLHERDARRAPEIHPDRARPIGQDLCDRRCHRVALVGADLEERATAGSEHVRKLEEQPPDDGQTVRASIESE